MPKVDDNKKYIALASNGTIAVPLKVDPVTGYLLAEIIKTDATSDGVSGIKIDENKNYVALAEDTNGDIKPLILDSENNYLFIDNG